MRQFAMACTVLMMAVGSSMAAIKTKTIEYEYDASKLIGFLAYDDTATEKRPGVLVVHEWWGLDNYARQRAEQLAKLGYVAFCVDMYGDGKTTDHPMEAGKFATAVRQNLKTWQGRATAGLKVLTAQEQVDPTRIAVIGYCFGGSTALELAYTGADLKAVATFHAALPTPTEEQAKAIKARVVVAHGADDKFIKDEEIAKFKSALETAGVKLQFDSYPGAVHSFTVKEVDAKKITGMAYNQDADEKSWAEMQKLFKEAFAK